MNSPPEQPPIAKAMQWASRLMTVCLEMVLPGVLGHWLDQHWGTSFLALLGFGFGLVAGTYHLLVMTGAIKRNDGQTKPSRRKNGQP